MAIKYMLLFVCFLLEIPLILSSPNNITFPVSFSFNATIGDIKIRVWYDFPYGRARIDAYQYTMIYQCKSIKIAGHYEYDRQSNKCIYYKFEPTIEKSCGDILKNMIISTSERAIGPVLSEHDDNIEFIKNIPCPNNASKTCTYYEYHSEIGGCCKDKSDCYYGEILDYYSEKKSVFSSTL